MIFNMKPSRKPEIHITDEDREILRNIAFAGLSMSEVTEDLLGEVERAKIAPPGQAVRYIGIGSTATYLTSEGREKTVRLVLPVDADIEAGRISILTPVGVALLGLAEGQEIDWKARDGRTVTLTVKKVHAD